jgi:hypothetical protein
LERYSSHKQPIPWNGEGFFFGNIEGVFAAGP